MIKYRHFIFIICKVKRNINTKVNLHSRNSHKYPIAIKSTTHSWVRYYFNHLCPHIRILSNLFSSFGKPFALPNQNQLSLILLAILLVCLHFFHSPVVVTAGCTDKISAYTTASNPWIKGVCKQFFLRKSIQCFHHSFM